MPSSTSIKRLLKSVGLHFAGSRPSSKRRRSIANRIPVAAVCDVLEPKQLLTAALIEAIPGQHISAAADTSVINLSEHFDDTEVEGSVVSVQTPSGTFYVETFDEVTPESVSNFLQLVEGDNYDNMVFHRLASGFVLQGGGFRFPADASQISTVENNGFVVNEFNNWFNPSLGGLEAGTPLNVRGTLAYAKQAGNPNSATSQWFVNLGDNSANLDSQNGGFTVFARVLYDGLDVVDDLTTSTVVNAGGVFDNLPVIDWQEGDTVERENLLQTTSTIVDELSYSVSITSGSNFIDAAIVDGVLTVTGTEAANSDSGYATIVVDATDVAGNVVQESFRVAIGVPADATVTGPNGVVHGQTTIAWLDSEAAETYDLWISRMQDVSPATVEAAGIVSETGLTESSFTVEEALQTGIYRAWVRPHNSVGAGAWSPAFEFVVGLEQPGKVTINSATASDANPLRVTLDWTEVDQAPQYQVWIADSQGTVVVNETVTGSTYFTDFDLTSGESYRAWVRGVNHRFTGDWSFAQSFVADLNTDPVTITNPVSSIASTAQPLIEWTSSANHDSYEVWISQVGKSGAFLRETTSSTSFQPTSDFPDGVYQVWVRPPASTGIAWSVPIVVAVGSQAQLTGPTGTVSSTPTITWSDGIPGTTSQLWLTGPTGRVFLEDGLTGTSFEVTEALPDGAYTAWVRQTPAVGSVFAWSTAFRFEVGASTTPAVPSLTISVDGSTTNFVWNAVEHAVRYELWVNSSTTSRIISETALSETSFEATLTEAGQHRAWLRAFNADDVSSAWTSVQLFTV